MLPSGYPELQEYPYLREMLRRQIDMQFTDLATLLQLPLPSHGLDAGANLTTTVLLCNVISGASVLFFEASLDSVRGRRTAVNTLHSSERFRRTLEFFPWDDLAKIPRWEAIDALYKYARNPLAHSLGVGKAPSHFPGLRGRNVLLAKRPLPRHSVAELMCGDPERPIWSDAPVIAREANGYAISVEALAWGTCRMLRSLFASPVQVMAAETTAEQLLSGTANAG